MVDLPRDHGTPRPRATRIREVVPLDERDKRKRPGEHICEHEQPRRERDVQVLAGDAREDVDNERGHDKIRQLLDDIARARRERERHHRRGVLAGRSS